MNYVGIAYNHNKKFTNPALLLIDVILKKTFLMDEIRVLGGAYGYRCSIDNRMRQAIVSYKDPNLLDTYARFERIPDFIK